MRAMAELVSRGLRAQLHSQSLISSALFVSFDIFPNAPPAQLRLVDDPDGKGKLWPSCRPCRRRKSKTSRAASPAWWNA